MRYRFLKRPVVKRHCCQWIGTGLGGKDMRKIQTQRHSRNGPYPSKTVYEQNCDFFVRNETFRLCLPLLHMNTQLSHFSSLCLTSLGKNFVIAPLF